MNEFEQRLMRLKECLQLTEDQQIAQALGMTKAAFSNRKRSGSFPEQQVIGLKAKWPNLDVTYVLLGERWSAEDQAAHLSLVKGAVQLGIKSDDVARGIATGVVDAAMRRLDGAVHDEQVRSLLEILEWCDRDAIDLLLRLAARLRGTKAMPFSERAHFTHAAGAGKAHTIQALEGSPEGRRVVILASREDAASALVLDEAHRSNPRTSGAVKGLSSKATIGMTATPKRATPAATQVEGVTKQQSRARAKAKPHRA